MFLTYSYNDNGKRVDESNGCFDRISDKKKDSSGQTYYDWDESGLRCLRQKDSTGATTARHVHG
mgnify:CR=1 FL=1